jgi:hypothetical protein
VTGNTLRLAAVVALGTSGHCSGADYSLFFTVSNAVSPLKPSATVTLWASFPQHQYAFAGSNTEVWSPPDDGAFSDPTVQMYQDDYCDPGVVSPDGDSILGMRLLQLQNLGGLLADTSNPLELWSATWTTEDFMPRRVPIATSSSNYWVYTSAGGHGEDFYGEDFSEAHDFIRVVPSPPAAAVSVGVAAWLARRRREA